jgi:hypothetical protein
MTNMSQQYILCFALSRSLYFSSSRKQERPNLAAVIFSKIGTTTVNALLGERKTSSIGSKGYDELEVH